MKETKLYKHLQTLKKNLEPMTWPQRIDHIWTYYKEIILITVATLILMIGVGSAMLTPKKELLMGGMFVNTFFNEEAESFLGDELFEYMNGDAKKQEIKLYTKTFTNPALSTQDGDVLTSIYAMMAATQIDYFFMNEIGMKSMISMQGLLDLRQVFTAEELEQLKDDLFYGQERDDDGNLVGEPIPVAIKVSKLPFIKECEKYTYRDVYLGFAVNAPNQDSLREFWDYILAWKSSK